MCLLLHISIHFKFEMFNKNTSLYFSDEPCLLYKRNVFIPGQKNFRCVFKCFKGNVHEKKIKILLFTHLSISKLMYDLFLFEVSGAQKKIF